MADTASVISKGGGGLLSPQGSDVITSLASSDATFTAAANMGKVNRLYNNRIGAKITLPSGATLTGNKAKSVGIILNDNAPPVAVFNAGTAGTDAVLEAVLPGGFAGALSEYAGTAQGTWGKAGGVLPGFPWHTGAAPVTKTLGATAAGTTTSSGFAMCFLSASVAVIANVDNNNDVQLSAIGIGTNGQVTGVSNATSLRSGANVFQSAQVSKVDTNKVLVRWWDNTATMNEFVCVSITPGATPTIGAPGAVIDDSAALVANDRVNASNGTLQQDTTDAAWFIGKMNVTAGVVAYHFTIATTTITLNTTNKFNTTATVSGTAFLGYVYSAGNIMVLTSTSASGNLYSLNYAGGAITQNWVTFLAPVPDMLAGSTGPLAGAVMPVDTTNGDYAVPFTESNNTQGFHIFRINTSTGALTRFRSFRVMQEPFAQGTSGGLSTLGGGAGGGSTLLPMTDGEAMSWVTPNYIGGFIYFDLKAVWNVAGAVSATVGIATDEQIAGRVYQTDGWLTGGGLMGSRICYEPTTRTMLAMMVPPVTSGNWAMWFNTWQLPRR